MTEDQQRVGERDRFSPCAWCHEPFRPPKPTGRRPIHCSQACRQAAYKVRRDEKLRGEGELRYILGRASGGQPAVPPTVQAGPELRGAESPPLF